MQRRSSFKSRLALTHTNLNCMNRMRYVSASTDNRASITNCGDLVVEQDVSR